VSGKRRKIMGIYLASSSYAAANAAYFNLTYGPAGHGPALIGQDSAAKSYRIPPYVNSDGTVSLAYDITHLASNMTVIPTTDFVVTRVTSAGTEVDISATLVTIMVPPRTV
jgi:hypothetical protein